MLLMAEKVIETFTDAFIQSRKGALIHARGINMLPQDQVTAKSCALDGQDNGGDRRLGTKFQRRRIICDRYFSCFLGTFCLDVVY
ncbi:hypothetical protein E4U47_006305 [Claviceps purpurea]|nr:hypothetical protein E4U47_006305 [Claviceps purpurea]